LPKAKKTENLQLKIRVIDICTLIDLFEHYAAPVTERIDAISLIEVWCCKLRETLERGDCQ
jgi:hypothetical protein